MYISTSYQHYQKFMMPRALTSPMVGLVSGINIFTYNLSVAQKAGFIPKGSSQAGFARFKEGSPTLGPAKKMITVQWVPSHVGIQGNEEADIKAKKTRPNPLDSRNRGDTTKERQSVVKSIGN